jgi:methylated-DNA-protein-cysteine methyltransferase-like protein
MLGPNLGCLAQPRMLWVGTMDFKETVYAVVRLIPAGRVLSYGAVAALMGRPGAARAVGSALSGLSRDLGVPWWRVVNSTGRISTPQIHQVSTVQRQLLEEEKVLFKPSGRVDLVRSAWTPTPDEIESLRCRLDSLSDRIGSLERIE